MAATRASATPARSTKTLAVRYANAMTGEPRCDDDDDDGDDGDSDDGDDDDGEEHGGDGAGDSLDDEYGTAGRAVCLESDADRSWDSRSTGTDSNPGDEPRGEDPDAAADDLGDGDWTAPRDAIETGLAFTSTAFADAAELHDVQLRHHRPSRWGRVDVSIAWRRAWNVSTSRTTLDDALLLVATWRR